MSDIVVVVQPVTTVVTVVASGPQGIPGVRALSLGYPPNHYGWMIHPASAFLSAVTVPATDFVYLYPFPVFERITIYELFVRCNTGVPSSALKSAIWANNAAIGRPTGVPLASNNTGFPMTVSFTLPSVTVSNTVLDVGMYWAGHKCTAALPNITSTGGNSTARGVTTTTLNDLTATTGLNVLRVPDAYANDIAALDLTSATFTVGGFSGVPALGTRWR